MHPASPFFSPPGFLLDCFRLGESSNGANLMELTLLRSRNSPVSLDLFGHAWDLKEGVRWTRLKTLGGRLGSRFFLLL